MKSIKKIVLTAVVLLLISAAPLLDINLGHSMSASAKTIADEGACGENLTYKYDGTTKELIIRGAGAMSNFNSSSSPFNNSDVVSVIVEDGITSIGNYAFSACSSLESIQLPSTLQTIGERAFNQCAALKSIYIPEAVTKIQAGTFNGCVSLETVCLNNVKSIGNSAFKGCTSLKILALPDGVTEVVSSAFNGCTSLVEVDIGTGLEEIGSSAFKGCTSLETISGGENIRVLKNSVFMNCKLLRDSDIFNNLTSMDYDAIRGCESLTQVTVPLTDSIIESTNFENCKSLEKVIISGDVTELGDNLFYGFTKLQTVILPDNLTKIGNCSFYGCNVLQSIGGDIPAGLTSIGAYAFYDCALKGKFTIPNGITEIPVGAFYQCRAITELTIPTSVISIGNGAFFRVNSLTDIYYLGTRAQWNNVSISENNTRFLEAELHCIDDVHVHVYSSSVTTIPTCITEGVRTYVCECGDIYTEAVEKASHREITIFGKEATCTDTGLSDGVSCSFCGKVIVAQVETNMKDHSESDWIIDKNATCSVIGTKHTECTVCETLIKTANIDKLPHTEEVIPAVNATCTVEGLTEGKKCSVCGETLIAQTVSEKLSHTESDWIIDNNATCSALGSKHTECTVCEALIKTANIDKLPHSEEVIPAVNATCTDEGLTEGKKCSECGEVLVSQVITDKLPHTESDWIIDKNATCSALGAKHIECTVCEALIKTANIDKLPHSEEVIPAVNSTCTDKGLTEGKKCSVCGETLIAQTVSEKLPHTESDWIIDKNATCSVIGTKHTECTVCEALIKTANIDKLPHSEEVIPAVNATCTDKGLTEGKRCSECGKVLVSQVITDKLPHSEGDWIIDNNATCSALGSKHTECTVCEALIKTANIDKLPHSEEIIPAVNATCTTKGLTEGKRCSECGEVLVSQVITDKLPHSEGEWIIDKNATCSVIGTKHTECIVCKTLIKTANIDKLPHSEEIIPVVNATCTDEGLTEGEKCSVCGTVTEKQSVVSKLEHSDRNVDNRCDYCDADMSGSKVCSHICHKSGFSAFIWSVVRLFSRLFGINKVCECGITHY